MRVSHYFEVADVVLMYDVSLFWHVVSYTIYYKLEIREIIRTPIKPTCACWNNIYMTLKSFLLLDLG